MQPGAPHSLGLEYVHKRLEVEVSFSPVSAFRGVHIPFVEK